MNVKLNILTIFFFLNGGFMEDEWRDVYKVE